MSSSSSSSQANSMDYLDFFLPSIPIVYCS